MENRNAAYRWNDKKLQQIHFYVLNKYKCLTSWKSPDGHILLYKLRLNIRKTEGTSKNDLNDLSGSLSFCISSIQKESLQKESQIRIWLHIYLSLVQKAEITHLLDSPIFGITITAAKEDMANCSLDSSVENWRWPQNFTASLDIANLQSCCIITIVDLAQEMRDAIYQMQVDSSF